MCDSLVRKKSEDFAARRVQEKVMGNQASLGHKPIQEGLTGGGPPCSQRCCSVGNYMQHRYTQNTAMSISALPAMAVDHSLCLAKMVCIRTLLQMPFACVPCTCDKLLER